MQLGLYVYLYKRNILHLVCSQCIKLKTNGPVYVGALWCCLSGSLNNCLLTFFFFCNTLYSIPVCREHFQTQVCSDQLMPTAHTILLLSFLTHTTHTKCKLEKTNLCNRAFVRVGKGHNQSELVLFSFTVAVKIRGRVLFILYFCRDKTQVVHPFHLCFFCFFLHPCSLTLSFYLFCCLGNSNWDQEVCGAKEVLKGEDYWLTLFIYLLLTLSAHVCMDARVFWFHGVIWKSRWGDTVR